MSKAEHSRSKAELLTPAEGVHGVVSIVVSIVFPQLQETQASWNECSSKNPEFSPVTCPFFAIEPQSLSQAFTHRKDLNIGKSFEFS